MSAAAMGSDWVGQRVNGRYTLLEWLGGTAEGGVFGTQLSGTPGQKAAIHLVVAEGSAAEARLAGWTIAKALPHPHLVRIFDAGRAQVNGTGVVYLVTEYADEVLSEVLSERPLTPEETRQMLSPTIEALSYLHSRGFVHGRIKPSNILVVGEQLKLSAEGQLPKQEQRKYRPALGIHDAPEIETGEFSAAADVWSLGVTLVEALTQHAILWERPADTDPVIPGPVPERFAQIAHECLRVDPAQRCTLDRVKALLEGQPVRESEQEVAPAAPTPTAAASPSELESAPARPSEPTLARKPEPTPQSVPEPASLPHHHGRVGELDQSARSKLSVMPLVIVFVVLVAIIIVLFTRSHQAPSATEPAAQTQAASGNSEIPTGEGVTREGAVVKRVQPDVLPNASKSIRGTVAVAVRLNVDSAGHVTSAELVTPGPSRYFAHVALESARQWEFSAPEQNGHAVASRWLLRYRFRNGGTEVEPREERP